MHVNTLYTENIARIASYEQLSRIRNFNWCFLISLIPYFFSYFSYFFFFFSFFFIIKYTYWDVSAYQRHLDRIPRVNYSK